MPVSSSSPAPRSGRAFKPPLLREHRLYQADWLLRFYHFRAEELLDEGQPNFDPRLDPKCGWALRHLDQFPGGGHTGLTMRPCSGCPASGVTCARRILTARRCRTPDLRRPEKAGGGPQAGPVLHHLLRPHGWRACECRQEGVLPPSGWPWSAPPLAQVQPAAALPVSSQTLKGGLSMSWTAVSLSTMTAALPAFSPVSLRATPTARRPACFSAPAEDRQITLWPERPVDTRPGARRSGCTAPCANKISPEAQPAGAPRLSHLSAGAGAAHLSLYLRLGYRRGRPASSGNLTDDPGGTLLHKAVQHLEQRGPPAQGLSSAFPIRRGCWSAEIEPKNRVLPLLRPHFCTRFSEEHFLIYDRTHREALFHQPGQWAILPLEDFQLSAARRGRRRRFRASVEALLRHHCHSRNGKTPDAA